MCDVGVFWRGRGGLLTRVFMLCMQKMTHALNYLIITGLKQLQSKLPLVDLILEVHDGRVSFFYFILKAIL